jgi:hypothetical protein
MAAVSVIVMRGFAGKGYIVYENIYFTIIFIIAGQLKTLRIPITTSVKDSLVFGQTFGFVR